MTRDQRLGLSLLALSGVIGLLLACSSLPAQQLATSTGPRWACPSPTPKPWGTDGPVKTVIHHTRAISEGGNWDENVYYQQWEQEYPGLGPPFPSPTPYGRVGTSYTFGQRVEIGPLHLTVTASAGALVTGYPGIPDGTQQIYRITLQWLNRSTTALPINYGERVRLRAIKIPSGAVLSNGTWGPTMTASTIAALPVPAERIPTGSSSVQLAVLAPPGQPETVDVIFLGDPNASYTVATATPDPSHPAPPAPATPSPSPSPVGNPQLQNRDPQFITVQWSNATWVPPGGQPCGDPGALTDWGSGGAAWGSQVLVGGPPAPPGSARVVQIAMAQIGKPYVWGAKGPTTFDCSGLCTWSYGQIGITIPQGTVGQWPGMKPVDRAHLQPGDLVFFALDGKEIDHVGMLVGDLNGDGKWDMVHAACPKLGIRLDYSVFESHYYGPTIRGFRTAR